jgi:hypothetical protein
VFLFLEVSLGGEFLEVKVICKVSRFRYRVSGSEGLENDSRQLNRMAVAESDHMLPRIGMLGETVISGISGIQSLEIIIEILFPKLCSILLPCFLMLYRLSPDG